MPKLVKLVPVTSGHDRVVRNTKRFRFASYQGERSFTMFPLHRVLIPGIAIAAMALAGGASAQEKPGAVYCVTYIEVAPSSRAEARTLLKQLAAARRTAAGKL